MLENDDSELLGDTGIYWVVSVHGECRVLD